MKLQEALGVPKTQPIILYFDEANALHKVRTSDGDSYYDALCTALNGIRPAFGIFLSTKSSLAEYAPPAEQHASSRVHDNDHLLAPFTELPFDVHPQFPIWNVELAELHEVSFMCRFGRPL